LSTFECLCLSTRIWSIWLWGFPSGDIQVYLWMLRCGNIVLLTLRCLDVAKFINLTPLALLISCELSFSIVGLKMSSLPTLALKSPSRIFLWYLGNLSNTRSEFLVEAVLSIISFIFCSSMNVQNNDITPATSQYYVWHPITNKLNPLNCWYDSLNAQKKLYLIHDFHSPFHRKMCVLPPVRHHSPPIWPPALSLDLTYISTVPSKLMWEPTLNKHLKKK
jgi:hypothetical protein